MSSCFVKGCTNGYRSKRKENIRLGIKQKCLFKSPKCAELRKKWCHALGLKEDQLKLHHVICEDHFHKSDIIKYDITHLPDGTRILLERGTCRLRPQSVPSISTPVVSITKIFRITSTDSKEQKQTGNDNPGKDSKVTVDSSCIEGPIKVEEYSTQESADIQKGYSFEKLLEDIKLSNWSSRWASMLNADSIDFLNWDAAKFKITMVLRIFGDLTMKFFTADKHLIKNLDMLPKSFGEILQSLTLLEKTILCEGTGLSNKRSEECLGEVDVSKIEKRRGVWKQCKPCLELRKRELERQRESKRDVQRRLKLTNRKNSRLKIKVDKLKEDVERTKKKCAGIQEKSLYDRIAALPLPIQESVKACLAAAKVKPKGRRYTMNWIYECMLIRSKSRRIYEHLRTHFILPLPCLDTLDRYIKKMNTPGTDGISDCLEENLGTTVPIEKNDPLLLDDMTSTEIPDSDKSEISVELREMKKKLVAY